MLSSKHKFVKENNFFTRFFLFINFVFNWQKLRHKLSSLRWEKHFTATSGIRIFFFFLVALFCVAFIAMTTNSAEASLTRHQFNYIEQLELLFSQRISRCERMEIFLMNKQRQIRWAHRLRSASQFACYIGSLVTAGMAALYMCSLNFLPPMKRIKTGCNRSSTAQHTAITVTLPPMSTKLPSSVLRWIR